MKTTLLLAILSACSLGLSGQTVSNTVEVQPISVIVQFDTDAQTSYQIEGSLNGELYFPVGEPVIGTGSRVSIPVESSVAAVAFIRVTTDAAPEVTSPINTSVLRFLNNQPAMPASREYFNVFGQRDFNIYYANPNPWEMEVYVEAQNLDQVFDSNIFFRIRKIGEETPILIDVNELDQPSQERGSIRATIPAGYEYLVGFSNGPTQKLSWFELR
ncbi:MAG: hypothetical protein ACPGN3_15150 [Opitutales bacterium]